MIRVKKENHRSWFMSNYYPCEFVMNGIRYKMKAGKAHGFNRGRCQRNSVGVFLFLREEENACTSVRIGYNNPNKIKIVS